MPYKVKQENGQHCVHKLNADGSMGEMVKCHADAASAAAHVKALYANVKDSEQARVIGDALL